jgi:hypothetical protein
MAARRALREERKPLLSYSNKIRLLCALRDPAQCVRKFIYLSRHRRKTRVSARLICEIVSANIICRRLTARSFHLRSAALTD